MFELKKHLRKATYFSTDWPSCQPDEEQPPQIPHFNFQNNLKKKTR